MLKKLFIGIHRKNIILNLAGAFILAVGIYNIHSISTVTEGGVIGLTLLIEYWLGISPALSNFVLTAVCYFIGYRQLGREFIVYSAVACLSYSVFYAVLEQFPRVYPPIAEMPLAAALVGAVFVGIGAGLCVRGGGAQSGDDALAMAMSSRFRVRIQTVYLISDMAVLAASLSYLPISQLVYSLITVVLSGQIIGFVTGEKSKK